MHSFDTILLQPKKAMAELIQNLPLNDIALALKFEEQDIKDYFFENMNEEQNSILRALINEIDEATPHDSKKAQFYIMEVLENKEKG